MATKQRLQFVVDKLENFFETTETLNFPTNVIEEVFEGTKVLVGLGDALDVLRFMLTEIEYTENKDRIEKLITGDTGNEHGTKRPMD